jgi:hypothetical protein
MTRPLRRGDTVRVRRAAEILATLDQNGALEGLPFMPEMVRHCGGRFAVSGTAARVCDTIDWSGSRSIPNTVLLDELRCDGSAHAGCQGECRYLWKEAWLERVKNGEQEAPANPDEAKDREALLDRVRRAVKRTIPAEGGQIQERYRCQLTEMKRASQPASRFPYAQELLSGNVAPGRYARVIARAFVWETMRRADRLPRICLSPTQTPPLRRPALDLKPGEWVRIRSPEEIAETMDATGSTRGLWFDREMLQFCGRTVRVKERVTRFIHDDGRLINLKSAAVKLEDVHCKGDYSVGRWFCPRALYPYWREDWLERAEAPASAEAG